jgi:hypothetical protein
MYLGVNVRRFVGEASEASAKPPTKAGEVFDLSEQNRGGKTAMRYALMHRLIRISTC